MAGLFFVVCGAIEELYRVGKVFVQSDGSFDQCWKYVQETRQERFIKRYLDYLDNRECAIGKTVFANSKLPVRKQENNNCWWDNTPDNNTMAYQEIYEFTPSDEMDYVTFTVSSILYFVICYNIING